MGKKSKRQSRKRSAASTATLTTSNNVSTKSMERDFNPDYSQTIKDLRRIGILAITFFSVLILLAIFLR